MPRYPATRWLVPLLAVMAASVPPARAANEAIVLKEGVYSNLVLGVKQGTPEPIDPTDFLAKLSAFLEAGSEALHFALDGRASFGGDVTLVIPRSWDSTKFPGVKPALPTMTIDSADILLHDIPDTVPETLQSGQCGVPGQQIQVPIDFLSLSDEEEKLYGTPGRILTHEWAHYRYGAHDEHGFGGDPVYGSSYGGTAHNVTSCAAHTDGQWRTQCVDGDDCAPGAKDCFFCFSQDATAATVQASLGYLPALSDGKFCTAANHNRDAPTPQNILCGGRSVSQLIMAHPDAHHMAPHAIVPPTLVLREEPLAQVLLVLDTPDVGEDGSVLDYLELLHALESPLTQYRSLKVGMVSYRADEDGEISLYNERKMAPIPQGGFNSLEAYLPRPAKRKSVPDLNALITKLLEDMLSEEYEAGTLLVMPLTNTLVRAAENLMAPKSGDWSLRMKKIKPLMLFPEYKPEVGYVGSTMQWTGGRFVGRNATSGPLNYAAHAARTEVQAFVDNTFSLDHVIVHVDKMVELAPGEEMIRTIRYQGSVSQHRLAVIYSNYRNFEELSISYKEDGSFRECEEDICPTIHDTIFFLQSSSNPSDSVGEEWTLKITNIGNRTNYVWTVWSSANFVGVPPELEVRLWSSDGGGPVAEVPENNRLALYVRVLNNNSQVLSSRITLVADVFFQLHGNYLNSYRNISLLDDGEDMDIRRDDSVYSYGFPEGTVIEEGTIIYVVGLVITGHPTDDEESVQLQPVVGSRRVSSASSGLYTRDPSKNEPCCGSFVEHPNVDESHGEKGFSLHLFPDHFKPIVVTRTIDPSKPPVPPPTIAPPSTAPPSTAPPSTAPPSTAPPSTNPSSTNPPSTSTQASSTFTEETESTADAAASGTGASVAVIAVAAAVYTCLTIC